MRSVSPVARHEVRDGQETEVSHVKLENVLPWKRSRSAGGLATVQCPPPVQRIASGLRSATPTLLTS